MPTTDAVGCITRVDYLFIPDSLYNKATLKEVQESIVGPGCSIPPLRPDHNPGAGPHRPVQFREHQHIPLPQLGVEILQPVEVGVDI